MKTRLGRRGDEARLDLFDHRISRWSAVRGLAMLVIAGPLHVLPDTIRHDLGQRLLDMVEAGL